MNMLGWASGDNKEVVFLGRTLRAVQNGLTIEGDPKHVQKLLEEEDMTGCRAVDTPFVKHDEVEGAMMGNQAATKFRRAAARINYMAQDRADLSFVSRYLSGKMARPQENAWLALKRCLRYLRKRPRTQLLYAFQEWSDELLVYTDSDWASDEVTRRSTSGGTIHRGQHLLGWWSKLQARVALSSCEAEVNGMVKAAAEALHMRNIGDSFGDELNIRICTDASAAKGVAMRSGAGKLKHLHTKQLWIQEYVIRKEISIEKIPRARNIADALTHGWTMKDEHFFVTMGFTKFQNSHDGACLFRGGLLRKSCEQAYI